MWRLPDGKTLTHPRGVTIGDVQYPAAIFTAWSVPELFAIGILPFREEKYDTTMLVSISHEDVLEGEGIVRRHTTQPHEAEYLARRAAEKERGGLLSFLNESDYKVLRHLGQTEVGKTVKYTSEEFIKLEDERQAARDRISEIDVLYPEVGIEELDA